MPGRTGAVPANPDQPARGARLRLAKNAAMVAEKELVEAELGDTGRVLIRASGTEPLIRVMVEAKDKELAESMARRIADKVGV